MSNVFTKIEFDKYGEFLPVRNTLDELRNYPTGQLKAGDQISVTGRNVFNDGQGTFFVWDPNSQAADNGTSIIQPGTLVAGRWLAITASLLGPQGPTGATGPTGPAGQNGQGLGDVMAPGGAALVGYQNRTVADKLGEMVSVKDFGAKGDGTNNDTSAIQRALDSVGAKGGGMVFIPRGTYKVAYIQSNADYFGLTCLRIPSNVTLCGEGPQSLLRLNDNDSAAGAGAAATIIRHKEQSISNVTIREIGIDGNLANQPKLAGSPGNGGNISLGVFNGGTCQNVRIENVYSINAFGQGIQVVGQVSTPGKNIWIVNNTIVNASFIGIQSSSVTNCQISGNSVDTTGDNGIDIYGDANVRGSTPSMRDVVIFGNRIRGAGGAGIFPETVAFTSVYGNTITQSINGIHWNVINSASTGNKCFGNTVRGVQNCYVVSGALEVVFTDNYGEYFTQSGLCAGVPGGESSTFKYDRFTFKPGNNTVPLVLIDKNVIGHNFVDPGVANYLIDVDINNPTPQTLYRKNVSGAPTTNSPYPTFQSATNPAFEGVRLPNARLEGTPHFSNGLPVYATNAAAKSALGVNALYTQTAGGPVYITIN
jgi:hypothetical protein